MSAVEFASRIQEQADAILAVAGTVDDGTGRLIEDRASFEFGEAKAAVPPSIILSPPSWTLTTYCDDEPGELVWRAYVVAPNDEHNVARLWMMSLSFSQALDAAGRGDSDYPLMLGCVVNSVEIGAWSVNNERIPAYVVQFTVPLP